MKRLAWTTLAVLVLALGQVSATEPSADKQQVDKTRLEAQRAEVDLMASKSLDRLHVEKPETKAVHKNSYGYAVFDTTKVAFGISGGGGAGVAVASGQRVYMRMATVGVGASIGAQNYQLIMFFADKDSFRQFISEEWNAEASAAAGAGDKGGSGSGTSEPGVKVYKLSDAGVMVSADVSGVRFWKVEKLNP